MGGGVSQFSVSGLAIEFGVTRLFANATFTIERGERWGVVGRNGTGKTTLFRLLAGTAQPTRHGPADPRDGRPGIRAAHFPDGPAP